MPRGGARATIVTHPRHELETVIPEHEESILCVDDDPLLCRLLERMLNAAGYHCVAVGSAEEARQVLGELTFGLVLCDIDLRAARGSRSWRR